MADVLAIALKLAIATLIACVAWGTFKVSKVIYRSVVLKRQFPNMPSESFIFGVLNKLAIPDRHKVLARGVQELGPNFYLRLAWLNVLVITEPALVMEVMHNQDLDKVDEVYAGLQPMMSETGHTNLLTSPTDEGWRLVRKGVAPAFSPHNIRKGFHHAAACGDQLVQVLLAKGGEAVNIGQACLSETIDMIGLFGFAHNFNALTMFGQDKHAHMMDVMLTAEEEVQRRLQDPTRVFFASFTQEGRDAVKSFKEYQSITRELLAEMRARGEPDEDDGSIGALLMRIRDANGQPLSDEVLLPQIAVFFFAGFDTTGHTLAWTLYLLSQNPEAEARIVAELRELGLLATPEQPHPRALEYTDLAKLTCLNDALKESMRLKPVAASGTVRQAAHDITLGGGKYRIPAGTSLWVPIHSIHTSKENWGDSANRFKPERWMDPNAHYQLDRDATQQRSEVAAQTKKVPSASASFELGISRSTVGRPDAAHIKRFLPFGDGKRDCVGQSMARMNAMSTLARLLSHFHFDLAPEMGGAASVEAQEVIAITLQPGGDGIVMNCISRAGIKV